MAPKKRRITAEPDKASSKSADLIQDDVHLKLSNEIAAKKQRKNNAKFRLKGTTGNLASVTTPQPERIPLMLTDVQHLLLHSLLGNLNLSQPPRWYVLEKCTNIAQTTCLVLEGMSIEHWEKYKNEFPCADKIFSDLVEVVTPSAYEGSLVDELALVPLSETEKEDLILKYGSLNLALEARKDLNSMMRAVFPIEEAKVVDTRELKDQFPRTQLIMSAWQLAEESYPLPLKGKLKKAYADYVMTKDMYQPATANSPMFGLDCEMCMTNAGSELTRVSIVNEKHETVYESLVKPYNNITDYLTRYSGINKAMLTNVSKRLEDVQNDLRALFPPDAILIGQSLNVDLHALKMMHPYVIDTSLIFNFTGERSRKPKLKALSKELLHEDIQSGRGGHDSVEDSLAALKLVQLKLSKTLEFGDAVHTNRQKYKENVTKMIKTPDYALSIFNHMIEQKKSSIIIGCDDITGEYHSYLTKTRESLYLQLKKPKIKKVKLSTLDEREDVIDALCKANKEYNFSMAHLKLEIQEENLPAELQKVDKWIETVWNSVRMSTLVVVLFGGTTSCNGLAMMKIKS
ncbi:unnamed protein product [Plutella xylostella]|uniref:(diamondback moth) hypothetical protein n=1 Tax=Plutella xylostella TaxID=51655 RepID=A0A8S4D335_PLUXY|nr:unnamed protein product [Plutella xylostella]